ncbi:MAG: hypothetical protein Q7K55_06305 [Candidatus Levybacteria bacterium]|nr:hypothetical protein [Candidatus Levybacteria bacterium]
MSKERLSHDNKVFVKNPTLPYPDSPESLIAILENKQITPSPVLNDRSILENRIGGRPLEPILRMLVEEYKMSSRQIAMLFVDKDGIPASYGTVLRAFKSLGIEPISRKDYKKTERARQLQNERSIAIQNKKRAKIAENLGVSEDLVKERIIELIKQYPTLEQVSQRLKTQKQIIREIAGIEGNEIRTIRVQGIYERAVRYDVLGVLSKREIDTIVSCTKITETELARKDGYISHQAISAIFRRAKRKIEEAIKQKTHPGEINPFSS